MIRPGALVKPMPPSRLRQRVLVTRLRIDFLNELVVASPKAAIECEPEINDLVNSACCLRKSLDEIIGDR